MNPQVIDASVAIKWFAVEEHNSANAIAILKDIEKNPKPFAVPELFFNEMLAVFCRFSLAEDRIVEYMDLLQSLGLHRIGNGAELLASAAKIASKYGISGYDAIYASCAKLMSGVWVTADEKAHQKIALLKISRCI